MSLFKISSGTKSAYPVGYARTPWGTSVQEKVDCNIFLGGVFSHFARKSLFFASYGSLFCKPLSVWVFLCELKVACKKIKTLQTLFVVSPRLQKDCNFVYVFCLPLQNLAVHFCNLILQYTGKKNQKSWERGLQHSTANSDFS